VHPAVRLCRAVWYAGATLPMAATEFALTRPLRSDRRTPVRWVLSHARRQAGLLLLLLTGAAGNAALAALVPVLVGQAFNVMSGPSPDLRRVGNLALVIAGSQVIRGLLQLLRNFSAELSAQRVERDVRHELYASLLGKSMTFHSLQPVCDTMARATNDVRQVNFMFSPGMNLVIGSANFMLMPLLIAPRYHPSLLLVPASYIVAYGLAVAHYLRQLEPVTESVRRAFGALNSRLAEALDGIEVVKGHAREGEEVRIFEARARSVRDASVRQGDIEARFLPLLLMALAEAGAFLHGLLLYRQGLLNLGQVIAYVGLIQLFAFPTFVSLWAYSQLSMGLASAQRILDLMNRETELDQNARGYASPMRGEIEFQKVVFAYGPGGPSLEGISFRVPAGQTVALVGQTGSGKTSLAKLVNRTHDATGGRVLVDGVDVRDWELGALRRQIAIIEQDVFLFSRTIAENIAFGRPQATPAEIEAAARAAQAHDFILALDKGYQALLGERGVTLSGGERQRIALARALLADPRILILDDSNSSIDSATEDQIQQALFRAARGRTTILITHRLSQIRWADQILVLRRGRVVAAGSHDELMRTSDSYRRIFARYEGG
jgi:ATP-binding cassette, subfamily B, bacterial